MCHAATPSSRPAPDHRARQKQCDRQPPDKHRGHRGHLCGISPNGGHSPDGAWYDTDGALYVADDLLAWDAQVADLIAYHEYEEVRHKVAGRAHAYAHRRAYLAELLAARHIFADGEALRRYLQWRIGAYPAWKGIDVALVVKDLERALLAQPLRKRQVLQVITDNRL